MTSEANMAATTAAPLCATYKQYHNKPSELAGGFSRPGEFTTGCGVNSNAASTLSQDPSHVTTGALGEPPRLNYYLICACPLTTTKIDRSEAYAEPI